LALLPLGWKTVRVQVEGGGGRLQVEQVNLQGDKKKKGEVESNETKKKKTGRVEA